MGNLHVGNHGEELGVEGEPHKHEIISKIFVHYTRFENESKVGLCFL